MDSRRSAKRKALLAMIPPDLTPQAFLISRGSIRWRFAPGTDNHLDKTVCGRYVEPNIQIGPSHLWLNGATIKIERSSDI